MSSCLIPLTALDHELFTQLFTEDDYKGSINKSAIQSLTYERYNDETHYERMGEGGTYEPQVTEGEKTCKLKFNIHLHGIQEPIVIVCEDSGNIEGGNYTWIPAMGTDSDNYNVLQHFIRNMTRNNSSYLLERVGQRLGFYVNQHMVEKKEVATLACGGIHKNTILFICACAIVVVWNRF